MFKDWYGNVIRRYAYFVEHGHSWEYDKKEKKYRWLGKNHPYGGGKTKSKDKEGKGGKSQEEEEEETDSDMPPLEPIPGNEQNDGGEEEEDSEEDEYDSDAHLWNGCMLCSTGVRHSKQSQRKTAAVMEGQGLRCPCATAMCPVS